MRPVNLIPREERSTGGVATSRVSGPHIVLAALAVLLLGVVGVVLAGNDVKNKQAEVNSLQAEAAESEQRAASLAAFTSFEAQKIARETTIADLAATRFDWERVLRELSRVLPRHVWLVNLTGTVSPEVALEGADGGALRGEIAGPALAMSGCGRSQRAVARMVSAVGDIDGVTRVSVERSEKPSSDTDADSGQDEEGGGSSDDCRTRNYVARFQLVAAFDEVPAPASALPPGTPEAPAPASPPPAAGEEAPPAEGAEPEGQRAQTQQSVQAAERDTNAAAGIAGAGGEQE